MISTFDLSVAEQWSPINTEGKKQYGREFLVQLSKDPLSLRKPTGLPSMDIIKDRPNQDKARIAIPNIQGKDDFTPIFSVKSTTSRVNCFLILNHCWHFSLTFVH